jgi:hypothetical protein
MEDHKKVEYVLGALLVFILLFVSIFIINTAGASKATTPQTNSIVITNSYNTITYEDNNDRYDQNDNYRYIRDRDHDERYNRNYDEDVRFSSHGEHKFIEGMFGQKISRYNVHVENKESHGEYFTVKFYFYDDDRDLTRVTSSTKYVRAHDEETFKHQNVNENRYEYDSWEYKVTSH